MPQLFFCMGIMFVDGLNVEGFADWITITALCNIGPGT